MELLFRSRVDERIATIVLSALVTHTAWHWTVERFDQLRRFDWPAMDAAMLASAMRWLILILILAGLIWLKSVLRPARKSERS